MCKIALTLKEVKDMCQRFDEKHELPAGQFNKSFLRISHFGDPIAAIGEVIEHSLEKNPAWVLKNHGLPAYERITKQGA